MFVRAESCVKTRSKLLETEFGSGSGFQDGSTITPKEGKVGKGADWKRETDLGAKKRPKTISQGSKIQPQGVQVASKIYSGGAQRSQVAKKRLLKASGTHADASQLSLGGHLGGLSLSKPVREALQKSN